MDNIFKNFMNIKFEPRKKHCDKHGDICVEVGVLADGSEMAWYCPLCQNEMDLEESEKLKADEEKKLIQEYINSNIEQEYWNKKIDDYKAVTESQKKALTSVKEIIEKRSGKLILLGSNGVGKTMLGSCAVKELGGKILSMYEISTMIRQSYTNRAEKTELEIVQELASIPFLVIDELGRTKGSDAELNWLSYVLDKRHVRNKPFMLLSNTHLMSKCPNKGCSMCFENYINNDILSRLRQNSKLINVDGPDYRANTLR